MKTPILTIAAAILLTTLDSNVYAQAFVNDSDGLLDVGEAPGFPAEPGNATGELFLVNQGIEDLDGTNLLTNYKRSA